MFDPKRYYDLCAASLALLASAPAFAQTAGVELVFSSGHADRGFIISDRAVVQPATWVGWSGAELSLWSSVPLTGNTDGSRPQITELELGREHAWGKVTIAPALRMYFYHDLLSRERDRSLEGWLNVSYDAGPFTLFTNHSLDVQRYPGAYYVDAGIASERDVSPRLQLGGLLGAGFGSARFNDAWAGVPIAALDRVSAEGWLTAHLKHFYIGPHFEYSSIVDRAVRTGADRPTYILVRFAVGGEF